DWESLANALQRVVSAHGDMVESKTAICNAIADKKIAVRVTIDRSRHLLGGMTFAGRNVGVPARLNLNDFDWSQSRPLHPWRIGPQRGEHYTWIGGSDPEPISLTELRTADVMRVLLRDGTEPQSAGAAEEPQVVSKSRRKAGRRPSYDTAALRTA